MWRWVGALGVIVWATLAWGAPAGVHVVVQTGDTVSGKQLDFLYGIDTFTDQGEIGYTASWVGDAANSYGVFSTQSGLVAQPGQQEQGGKLLRANMAGITGQGEPILVGRYQPPVGTGDAIFSPSRWILDTLTPITGTMIDGHPLYAIGQARANANGQVVYQGLTNRADGAAERGIARVGGGWLVFPGQMIEETPIFDTSFGLAQNALGAVVFMASITSDAQQAGIFTPTHKIVRTGDMVAGQAVQRVGGVVLNDGGEIVYGVTLTDGTFALVSTQRGLIAQTGQSFAGHMLTQLLSIDAPLALTNTGEVLWMGHYDDQQFGLFSSQRGLILSDGETIQGKTVLSIADATLNQAGQVAVILWYDDGSQALVTIPPPLTVAHAPVAFTQTVTGDFNGDGFPDEAGVTAQSTLWLGLAGQAWTQLPGRGMQLVAGDFNGDGKDDLAVLAGDTSIWAMTDLQHWQPLPGRLRQLVSGELLGTHQSQLAGIAWDSTLYLAPSLGQWQRLPGMLRIMVSGDFLGNGESQLAGVAWDTSLWLWTHTQGWQQLPGRLWTLEVVPQDDGKPDALQGRGWDGSEWIAYSLGQWQHVTTTAQQ